MFLLRRAALQGARSASLASQGTRSLVTTKLLVAGQQPLLFKHGIQKRLYSEEDGRPSGEVDNPETGGSAPKVREVSSFRTSPRSSEDLGPATPSKIIYVGNLDFDLPADKLRSEFARVGNVVNCKIVTDSSGLSKGFGYVEFDTIEEATQAIERLHQTELAGRRMTVQYHVRRVRPGPSMDKGPKEPTSTLFIGNMSFQMTDKDINDLFRPLKDVVDVRVAIDRRSGQPRGFAHADFISIDAAQTAKEMLETKIVYGRPLRIDFGVSTRTTRG